MKFEKVGRKLEFQLFIYCEGNKFSRKRGFCTSHVAIGCANKLVAKCPDCDCQFFFGTSFLSSLVSILPRASIEEKSSIEADF